MANQKEPVETVAEGYLRLLAARGVDYLFANAGTDFAPIVEAYAHLDALGTAVPKPILATHENLAVSMAHGYAIAARRVPAVMVHVSVGTANALCGIINAARDAVPILVTAGRSPITEAGMPGSRDTYIHWAQEMFDQGGMVREIVKWEYELRTPAQLETVVDRALAVATSPPGGPVYLSLPREVLAAPLPDFSYDAPSRHVAASPPGPDDAAIAAAARILARAREPLIITASAGREPAAVAALADFARRFAIPVVEHRHRHLSLPGDHPSHMGYDPAPHLERADAILVIECDVPWLPNRQAPRQSCKIIHVGVDPLFSRYPIRGFPCDLAITGEAGRVLARLSAALENQAAEDGIGARRARLAERRAALQARWAQARETASGARPIDPAWVSACIAAAKGEDAVLVNEYTLLSEHCAQTRPGSFFGPSPSAGLGWGGGAALGVKLARPDALVIAILGDGSHIFGNPVALHHAARLHRLPVLFVVVNNAMWGAVRRATIGMYPSGSAARSNKPPLIDLDELPAFDAVCAASGGYGERVEDPAELPAALARALHAVTVEKRQALLDVICRGP